MDERAELQRRLADARAKLEALPRADEVNHAHSVLARRTALQVKITSLQERLERTPVRENRTPPT